MTCPICGKVSDPAYRPFCSKRCADVDLGRWLGGYYRIETDEAPEPGSPEADLPREPRDD
ncbi:DNA gyrase inhibitor YacG [Tropicimonas sp.]|uniref:DNA gyrase inhibitor YacG n=1 Tax=Tropicimonas sp. TaxID=2067044 RepID=UPI003A8765B5